MKGALRRLYRASPRARRFGRRFKNMAVTAVGRFGVWFGSLLTLEQALWLGERLGVLLYHVLRTPRRLADEHLILVFGDGLSPAARARLARASFVNIARCLCELVKIDAIRGRADDYIEMVGVEYAYETLAQGRGLIAVTGHIGNWELLAAACAWKGFSVAAVARRIYAKHLNDILVSFRARQGVATIVRENPHSARQILGALKANTVLAMLIDQDTRVPSISVPFFGRLARTPVAAAALAIRRDIPAMAVFIQRRPQGGHRVTFHPPFVVERSGDRRADVRALTRQFNAALEEQIRKNPAEWVWWHRRWRRAPLSYLDPDHNLAYRSEDAVLRGRG